MIGFVIGFAVIALAWSAVPLFVRWAVRALLRGRL